MHQYMKHQQQKKINSRSLRYQQQLTYLTSI
jgi:hypothetical protein